MPIPINLSEATKLKHAKFRCEMLSARCVVTALESITPAHRSFKNISLYIRHFGGLGANSRMGWSDLDRLLVEFWESRSICLLVLCPSRDWRSVQEWVKYLLPEVMKRGIVDVVEIP